MTDLAQWLMVAPMVIPLLAGIIGLLLLTISDHGECAASALAIWGLAGATLAAFGLAVIMQIAGLMTVELQLGTWLTTTGSRSQQINWGWHVDQQGAIWLAVLTTLAWLSATSCGDSSRRSAEAHVRIATAFIVTSAAGLVLASTLVHLLACWLCLSAATRWLTIGSRTPVAVEGFRHVLKIGLVGDVLFFLAVVLTGFEGKSNAITDLFSPEGLHRLSTDNPAILGVIGSLIVISCVVRCGLFPFFGWHAQASKWDVQTSILIYAVGYVPAGIWVLLKCQPVLVASETSLTLLGGLGTLAAILGTFVAAGQIELPRRLAYLVASQSGFVLVALASGNSLAIERGVYYQCVTSVAAFLLFTALRAEQVASRMSVVVACCGAIVIAGLAPFGWTQHSLIELNTPSLVAPAIVPETTDDAADATTPAQPAPVHWDWIYGLWAAQGLTAFAAARGIVQFRRQCESAQNTNVIGASPNLAVILWIVCVLLLAVMAGLWLLQVLKAPISPSEWTRWGITEAIVLLGLGFGWRRGIATPGMMGSGPETTWVRLSREGLYVDQLFHSLVAPPWYVVSRVFVQGADAAAIDRAWRMLIVQGLGWLGSRIEGLQVSRIDFYLAAMLLGTATLLLTLVLID